MHPSAEKVQRALQQLGYSSHVVEMPDSTRTAKEAAQAIGCTVQQIAKSLVFRMKMSGASVLVIASGTNRVNEKWLADYLGEPVERGDADYVRTQTGFAIGGIPPIAHPNKLRTLIDQDLFQHETIWAAAGTPFAVFQLTPPELQEMTAGTITQVA